MIKNNAEDKNDSSGAKRKWELAMVLGWIASVISLAAIGLMLLGYGASMAIEGFGLPHSSVYISVFELIDLSNIPISMVLIGGSKDLAGLFSLELFAHFQWVLFFVFTLSGFFALMIFPVNRLRRFVRFLSRTGKKVSAQFQVVGNKDSSKQLLIAWVLPMIFFTGFWVLALLALIIPIVLALLLASMPLAGYDLGKSYIQEWVLKIDRCTWSIPVEMRIRKTEAQKSTPKSRMANCIALFKDGVPISEGLVVFTTSSAIILYNPLTKELRREPTSGMSIKAIDRPEWFIEKD